MSRSVGMLFSDDSSRAWFLCLTSSYDASPNRKIRIKYHHLDYFVEHSVNRT